MSVINLYDAQRAVGNLTIHTPYYTEANKYISRLIDTGASPKPKVGFLTGESGHGKTTICKMLLLKYPEQVTAELTTKPIVYITLSTDASVGDVLKSLYYSLQGVPMPSKGSNKDKEFVITEKLKDLKVKLIIIDEAQHAIKGATNEHGRTGAFINTLKTLLDGAHVPILVTGLPTLKNLRTLDTKNKDFSEQLRRRSFTPCRLPRFTLKETKKAIEYFHKRLEASGVSCKILLADMFVIRLYLCSKGAIAVIADFISSSLIEECGHIKITKESAAEAACYCFDDNHNMFDKTDAIVKKLLAAHLKEVA